MDFLDKFSASSARLRPNVIREMLKLTHGKSLISFAGGLPSASSFASREIREVISDLLDRSPEPVLQYGLTQGCRELLEPLCGYMDSRGVAGTKPENLLITSGAQQALDLLGRLLLDPGDAILVELPTYIGAITTFRNLGANLVGVSQDEEGISLEALDRMLANLKREGKRAAFLYTVPNFSNPSGVLMSPARRQKLVELARKLDFLIVEDDAYGELYFSDCPPEAVRPLSAWETEGRIIYVGTFSKTIAPGIRTGWVRGAPELIARLELVKQGADLFTSTLNQRIAAEIMARGIFQARLPGLRAAYEKKRDAMIEALAAAMNAPVEWNRPHGGFFVWLRLPPELDATVLMKPAIDAGVAYIPGQPFRVDDGGSNTIRLAFSTESEATIQEGIRKLSRFLQKASRGDL